MFQHEENKLLVRTAILRYPYDNYKYLNTKQFLENLDIFTIYESLIYMDLPYINMLADKGKLLNANNDLYDPQIKLFKQCLNIFKETGRQYSLMIYFEDLTKRFELTNIHGYINLDLLLLLLKNSTFSERRGLNLSTNKLIADLFLNDSISTKFKNLITRDNIQQCLNAVLVNYKYFRPACLGLLKLVNTGLRHHLLENNKFLLAILSFYSDETYNNEKILSQDEIIEHYDIIIIRENILHTLVQKNMSEGSDLISEPTTVNFEVLIGDIITFKQEIKDIDKPPKEKLKMFHKFRRDIFTKLGKEDIKVLGKLKLKKLQDGYKLLKNIKLILLKTQNKMKTLRTKQKVIKVPDLPLFKDQTLFRKEKRHNIIGNLELLTPANQKKLVIHLLSKSIFSFDNIEQNRSYDIIFDLFGIHKIKYIIDNYLTEEEFINSIQKNTPYMKKRIIFNKYGKGNHYSDNIACKLLPGINDDPHLLEIEQMDIGTFILFFGILSISARNIIRKEIQRFGLVHGDTVVN